MIDTQLSHPTEKTTAAFCQGLTGVSVNFLTAEGFSPILIWR